MSDHEKDTPKSSNLTNPWGSDPFGIRRVTLGGDMPGLQAEIDHVKRQRRAERKCSRDDKSQDDER